MKSKLNVSVGLATMWLMGGIGYPVLTVATKHLAPMNLVFVRTFGTAIILNSILLIKAPKEFKDLKFNKDLGITVICSILFYPICSGSLAYASSKTPGAITALLYSALPVISTIYLLIQKKPVHRKTFSGLAIALIALAILVGTPTGNVTLIGILAGLFSVFVWFIATEIWIKFNPSYSLLMATSLQAIIGSAGSYVVKMFFDAPAITVDAVLQGSVIFLIFSLATQHFAYLWLTTNVNSITLMLFSIINPFIAGVAGYLLFDQSITVLQISAGCLMSLGVYQIIKSQDLVTISK